MTFFRYNPAFGFPPPDGITNLIPVTEQSTALACTNANPALRHPGCTADNAATLRWAPAANYAYRGLEQWGYAEGATNSYNAGASYVTGSHSIRVGYQQYWLRQLDETIAAGEPARLPLQPGRAQSGDLPASDAEQQHGHPAARHLRAGPVHARPPDSVGRGPVGSGEQLRAGRGQRRVRNLLPEPGADYVRRRRPAWTRTTTSARASGVGYDVFGNGKTALKFRWGKYLGFASNDPPFTSTNQGATLVATVNRDWTDNDGDKVVDCNLLNNAAQGPATGQVDTCAAVIGNDANFGRAGAATIVDPELLKGWGVRTHDYQTEITLQQEVVPRVSAEVSYIHRTFHGFMVTDDAGPELPDRLGELHHQRPGRSAPARTAATIRSPSTCRTPPRRRRIS